MSLGRQHFTHKNTKKSRFRFSITDMQPFLYSAYLIKGKSGICSLPWIPSMCAGGIDDAANTVPAVPPPETSKLLSEASL